MNNPMFKRAMLFAGGAFLLAACIALSKGFQVPENYIGAAMFGITAILCWAAAAVAPSN